MTEKFLPPEEVMANAKAILQQVQTDPQYAEWMKAYKSSHHPLHTDAVNYAAQLFHLAETGSIEFEDGTINPAFMDGSEMQEIIQEGQAQKLAKRGVSVPESPIEKPEAKGGDEGEQVDTVASLHADPEFMKSYTQGRYDNPEGHAAAVERMSAAFQSEANGGDE